jgi:hypothetical protein
LLGRRRYEDILEELTVDAVEKKSTQCKQKWLNHVNRMEDSNTTTCLSTYRKIKTWMTMTEERVQS